MGKAYTPTIASSNTSSPVKTNMAQLKGTSPLQSYKSDPQPNGNPHVRIGPQSFNQPSHGSGLIGNSGQHVQNAEMRNPTNGVPHIHMGPGK